MRKNSFSQTDHRTMQETLHLARLAWGRTSPDPLVGCVVVKNGKIVGRGYHAELGTPHAEEFALQEAGRNAKGSTLYVNLEPCSHYGNNPPCVLAIRRYGVKRVVAAMRDPNPLVAGKGIAALRKAGIRVDVGLLEDEARRLNDAFVKYILTGLPLVTLKMAMSVDGKISTRTGESRWISGEESRRYVHLLRAGASAIMVGIGTVLADDPELTARKPLDVWNTVPKKRSRPKYEQPLRVIIDRNARTPLVAKIVRKNPEKTMIVVSPKVPKRRVEALRKKGVEVFVGKMKGREIQLQSVLAELGSRGLISVLLEGGGELNASALQQKVVHKVVCFIAPKIIGGRDAKTPVEGRGIEKIIESISLQNVRTEKFGNDLMIEGYLD